jgi:hypothetical protein
MNALAERGSIPSSRSGRASQSAPSSIISDWYRNGDIQFFGPVWTGIELAARTIVAQRGYRAPSTLAECVRVARTLVVTTSQLYRVLYRGGAPLIGNPTHVVTLPWP